MATPQLRDDFFPRRNDLWCFTSPLIAENMEKVKRLKQEFRLTYVQIFSLISFLNHQL